MTKTADSSNNIDFDGLALARRWSWRQRTFRAHLRQQIEAARKRYAHYAQQSATLDTRPGAVQKPVQGTSS